MTWLLGLFGGSSLGLWIVGIVFAFGAAGTGVQTWRLHSVETELAQTRAEFAQREAELSAIALAAEQRERAKEQSWAKAQQEITDATTSKIAAADAAASAAVSARDRLLERIQATAAAGRRARANPAPASGGAAAPDAIGVFADLLGKLDERAGLLASVADQRGLRGEACERFVEALRQGQADASPGR